MDKKRAKNIFKQSKVQYLSRLDSLNSNNIIHKIDNKVNRKIDTVLKSQQFVRWFGDWQNNPEKASKVVNPDGTPKVMYHGTQSSFTALFDYIANSKDLEWSEVTSIAAEISKDVLKESTVLI